MKKNYLILLATGLACVAACEKTPTSPDEQEDAIVITYIKAENSDNGTKASISGTDASFRWNSGDRIAVYTTDGYKVSYGLADTYNDTNAAEFAIGDLVDGHRSDFAVFPASLVWTGDEIRSSSATNHSASNLTVTLPAMYTLEQVQDEVSPCPMIATNAPGGDLSFKHLCALLRVTVSEVPAETRRLQFVFNGNKVQGEFTLTSVGPGISSIETAAAEGMNNTITVLTPDITEKSAITVNLPIPTGTYDYITISAYDAASAGCLIGKKTRLIKSSGTWTSSRLSSRKISTSLSPIATLISASVTEDVGKLIGADGNIYDNVIEATAVGTTAEAMIAYVGTLDGVCDNGLAISMTDAYGYNATYAEATGDAIIPSWAIYHSIPGGTWRLPSEKDWQYMMWGYYTSTPDPAPVGTIKTALSGGYYWTSTEIDGDNAKGIYYDGLSNASIQSMAKTGAWHVRACLSF